MPSHTSSTYPTIPPLSGNTTPMQALGIPFKCIGVSERNDDYCEVISLNNGEHIQHMFETLESMLQGEACKLHRTADRCVTGRLAGDSVSLGVSGSPCNPYSTQRAKRFADGSVANHVSHTTTVDSVITFYEKYEPNVGITEQVMGFGMWCSSSTEHTPMDLFFGNMR